VEALGIDASGNLYAGGFFWNAGGVPVNHIAKWDGTNWSALGSGVSYTVYSLAIDTTGYLYLAGMFGTAGGKVSPYIARCNLFGGGVTSTTTSIDGATTTTTPVTTTVPATATTTIGGRTTTTTVSSGSTTTTSVAAATTTTTTTGICPAKKALGENNPKLENLRDFRDSRLAQSAVGRRIINIYYNNADSINAALERSPALKAAARRVLEAIAPMVGP
jgi:hypothetical protein